MTPPTRTDDAELEARNDVGSRWRSACTFLALYGLSVVVTVLAAGGLRALIRWGLS